MKLAIRGQKMDLTPSILGHIRDRIHAALDQHAGRVHRVSIVVGDENGPRGGVDQFCRVQVQFYDGQTLRHQRRGEDLYANVSLLADTVKRRVGRYVDKVKQR